MVVADTGLQINCVFLKGHVSADLSLSPFWSDKTKMRSDIIQYFLISEPANLMHCQYRVNYSLHLEQNAL